jgi:hypothetical protein
VYSALHLPPAGETNAAEVTGGTCLRHNYKPLSKRRFLVDAVPISASTPAGSFRDAGNGLTTISEQLTALLSTPTDGCLSAPTWVYARINVAVYGGRRHTSPHRPGLPLCAVRVLARLCAASCAVPSYHTSPLLAPPFLPPPGVSTGRALGEVWLFVPGSGADHTVRSPDLPTSSFGFEIISTYG